jgi:hypothetical protein
MQNATQNAKKLRFAKNVGVRNVHKIIESIFSM